MLNLVLALLSNIAGPLFSIVWPFVLKHWKAILFDLMVVIAAFSLWHSHNLSIKLTAEKVSHAADIKSYRDAQATAEELAKQTKLTLDKQNKEKADVADKNYTTLLAQYNANLMRFRTNQSLSPEPSSGQQGSAAQGTSGPSSSSTIFISVNDAQICADNTARLQVAHDWAIDLAKGSK